MARGGPACTLDSEPRAEPQEQRSQLALSMAAGFVLLPNVEVVTPPLFMAVLATSFWGQWASHWYVPRGQLLLVRAGAVEQVVVATCNQPCLGVALTSSRKKKILCSFSPLISLSPLFLGPKAKVCLLQREGD